MLCVFVDTVYILNTLLSTHQTIQYCALNSTYLYFQQTQAIISFTVSTQYGMGIVVFNTPLSHTIGHCWDDLPSQSFDWCKNNLPNQSVADTSKTTITTTDDTKRNLNNNSWKLPNTCETKPNKTKRFRSSVTSSGQQVSPVCFTAREPTHDCDSVIRSIWLSSSTM